MDGTNGAPQGTQQGIGGGAGVPGGMPPGGPPGGPPGARGGGAMMFLGPWGGIVALVILVVTYIVLAIAFWQFLKKAGLTPAVALLMLIPVVNLGVALWAAFTEWPALKDMARLQAIAATAQMGAAAPQPMSAAGVAGADVTAT